MLSFQNKKVLVVDDSETMRMFIFFQLIKLLPGVQLMDAIDKLNQQDVDLILTDMNMPELDGAGVIRTIRQVFKKDTPIIIITSGVSIWNGSGALHSVQTDTLRAARYPRIP